jgi:hypothetical protein
MPGMLGKEVAETIRQVKPDLQVLYISGYARPVLASQGRLDPDVHLIENPSPPRRYSKSPTDPCRGRQLGRATGPPPDTTALTASAHRHERASNH